MGIKAVAKGDVKLLLDVDQNGVAISGIVYVPMPA